ncbi:hypothetical protein HK097_000613 [Rhizophlyctis rosea]|uniref:Berberine/berberine-like domain-containing protein n=1 Tax=Rhizophlyctis rosea TaxID=64517 RepID=A0AAD5X3N0_9FUNG|nr:hypothetical protein HK097_000613 [Rhizophlyctis rosea]
MGHCHEEVWFSLLLELFLLASQIVLPNATIASVTSTNDPDLWFALRGGLNRFGIVTKFTLKARPQKKVQFGTIYYTEQYCRDFFEAVADFTNYNDDPKAALIPTLNALPGGIKTGILYFFYDSPTPPPASVWANFTAIPHINVTISPQSFVQTAYPTETLISNTYGRRQLFSTTTFEPVTRELAGAIYDIVSNSFTSRSLQPGFLTGSFALEPIDQFMLAQHAAAGPAAFATPNRGGAQLLGELNYIWADSVSDGIWSKQTHDDIAALQKAAMQLGQQEATPWVYPPYASVDQPVQQIYSGTLERLRRVQRRVDVEGVFRNLTGGFNI